MKRIKTPLSAAIAAALSIGLLSAVSAQTMDSQSQGMPPGSRSTGINDPSSFSSWADSYSHNHHGRISRQAYMEEAGRRWDSMDRNGKGLTTAEIDRIYGPGWRYNQKKDSKGG